ncbi:MAG: FkbM family methyltransferase [Rhabdochlamydiaceae bacterium]|nr:FkbM family methyltransferase [Rhabdochlamydiaceae bacterium]
MRKLMTLIFFLGVLLCPKFSTAEEKKVFIGIVMKNYDGLIDPFLKSIDEMEYDKKRIWIQFDAQNNSKAAQEKIEKWVAERIGTYAGVFHVRGASEKTIDSFLVFSHPLKKFAFLRGVREGFLKKTKELGCDYCFLLDSDVLLAPYVLKNLMEKQKPIITPVLRPIPESNDLHSNFLATVNETGFSDYDCDFFATSNRQAFYENASAVTDRRLLGMWQIASAFGAYLIESQYIDKLSFQDEILSEDFFALARSAKKNGVDHFICNEKEFGSFIHFHKKLSLEEERAFRLIGDLVDVNEVYVEKIFAKYLDKDPDLKNYLSTMSLQQYRLFRIENRDLFFIDDIQDFIKTLYLKKGNMWERNIAEVLKAYVKEGSIAIDVGGHVGTHTLTLSRLVGPKGAVHVFEPQIKLFPELVINMALNKCSNVIAHRKALGSESKIACMINSEAANEGMCHIYEASDMGQKVPMEKLDHLQLNNISLIKMDVEGFEEEVLEGAKETITRNKPVMVIEITSDLERVQSKIRNWGYDIFPLEHHDYLCIPRQEERGKASSL